MALKIALAPTTCAFRDGSGDGSGWIGAQRVFANSYWRPRLVHFHRWIGGWIVMDRDGSCVQGCRKFPLAPTTCAFLAMDRRMDRDGSKWIVRSGLQKIHTGAHDLCIFSDGSADGS